MRLLWWYWKIFLDTVTCVNSEVVSAIGTALSAVAALIGLGLSFIVYKGQSKLSKQLASDQARVAREIHDSQKLLSQRQLLIPLWKYMTSLNDIGPSPKIIEPDVLKTVNTLELVALCCEGEMVDKAVIKRTFKDVYMKLFEQVRSLPFMSGLARSGPDLLNQNPASKRFYKELEEEHMTMGQLK